MRLSADTYTLLEQWEFPKSLLKKGIAHLATIDADYGYNPRSENRICCFEYGVKFHTLATSNPKAPQSVDTYWEFHQESNDYIFEEADEEQAILKSMFQAGWNLEAITLINEESLVRETSEVQTVVSIREAEQRDSKALYEHAKALATSFKVDEKLFASTFAKVLSSKQTICLVAETNNSIVAYLLGGCHEAFYANGPIGFVEELFVGEDYQKAGIGSNLMRSFETWCKRHHVVLITVATRRASKFYTTLGYEESANYFRKIL